MICWMDQKSFTRLTLTPDYRTTSEIQRAQGLLEEVLPTIPDAELLYGVFYNENTEYCTFEQSRICFRRNGILFRINKQYSPKPTYTIDIDTSDFKHVDLHMQARIRDKYPAPHRIGVLSEHKVNIWVDYLTKIWHDLEHLDRERNAHIAAHRSRLDKLRNISYATCMSIASGCRAGALTRAAGSSAGCFCISTSMTTTLRMLKLRDATFRGNGSRPCSL